MSKICDSVQALILPILDKMNIELVEVEFKKRGENDGSLTIYIDKEGGVSLDDCEAVHNAIDAPLDELDPTDGKPYTLNVSSPGIDRPFKSDRDYVKHIGTKVETSLFAPIEGVGKKFVATLTAYDPQTATATLEADGKTLEINTKNIAIIREHIEF